MSTGRRKMSQIHGATYNIEPHGIDIGEAVGDTAKIGYKTVNMIDTVNETAMNKLSLVEENKDLFQFTPSYDKGNFIQNIITNKMRKPLERVSIKPNLDLDQMREAGQILIDKGINPEIAKSFLMTKPIDKGAEMIDDSMSFINENIMEKFDIVGKLDMAGDAVKAGSKVAGKVAPFISAGSAIKEFSEGDIKEGVHDTIRVGYGPLAASGPYGWGVIALNELWDFFS